MRSVLITSLCVLMAFGLYGQSLTHEFYTSRLNSFLDLKKKQYGENLKDSIWNDLLGSFPKYMIGSKFDNFKFRTIENKDIELDKIKEPLFFQATASWCKPCLQEIPALNELVDKYDGKITFVLVAHDKSEAAIKLKKKLNPKIILIASTEELDAMEIVKLNVSEFNHILPFPTSYFADREHVIKEILVGAPISDENKTKEQVFEINIKRMSLPLDKLINDVNPPK